MHRDRAAVERSVGHDDVHRAVSALLVGDATTVASTIDLAPGEVKDAPPTCCLADGLAVSLHHAHRGRTPPLRQVSKAIVREKAYPSLLV